MNEVIKAMETLKNYCKETKHCSECVLEYMCEVSPIFWDIPEEPKSKWKQNFMNKFIRSE